MSTFTKGDLWTAAVVINLLKEVIHCQIEGDNTQELQGLAVLDKMLNAEIAILTPENSELSPVRDAQRFQLEIQREARA